MSKLLPQDEVILSKIKEIKELAPRSSWSSIISWISEEMGLMDSGSDDDFLKALDNQIDALMCK